MLLFENFLKAYLQKEYSYTNLNAVVIKTNERFNSYHYYIRKYDNDYFEIMINQVDNWTSMQGGAINFAEVIVNQIAINHQITTFDNIKFTIITRHGIKNEDYQDILHSQQNKSIARFEKSYISDFTKIVDTTHFIRERYIYLDLDIVYSTFEECHSDLVIIQRFLNSLTKKTKIKNESQKKIYEALNLNEQTFYSWKKKNPKLFEAVVDGFFYKDIKEIVSSLSTMQELMSENWATYEPMRYLDGEEY